MFQPNRITPIIKLVENCNYTCSFCRYANHPPQEDSIMSMEMCKYILEGVCLYNRKNGQNSATLIFHGGEPLLWGKKRFREIYAYEKELERRYEGFCFFNGMQSNGYLLDEEWMDIFKEMKMSVGISLDGPENMNFHYGTSGNSESIRRVIDNIHMLQRHGATSGILSVITDNHLGHAKEYFDFLHENGITDTGFCYCYNPRDNISIDPIKLAEFLCESFDIYYHSKKQIRVREFDNTLLRLYNVETKGCLFKERCECGSYICISPNGMVSFCDAYEADSFNVGNIMKQSLEEVISSDEYQNTKNLYLTPSQNACKACEFRCVCGCGCGRNDIGEGSEQKSYFCETYKILYRHILDTLKADRRLLEENKKLIM